MRQLAFPMFELPALEREAIEFIRKHEPPEGCFVGFSGGKDSIALLQLVKLSGVKYEAWHTLSSIDPPEVVKLVKRDYPEVKIVKPEISIYEGIAQKCPPLRMRRWCCDWLRKHPTKKIPLTHRLMGIRAEESKRRASRPRIDSMMKWKIYKPLFHWPEWAVWEFINKHSLKYPSLYDEGEGRIGCVVCPFIMGESQTLTRRREQSMERWPGIWRAYKNACRKWFEKKRANNEGYTESFDEWWDKYLNGFE